MSESRVTWATSVPILVFLGLLLISKTATLHAYIRQNVDIIPVSSVNVITVVVYHLRNKNTFTTDACYVQYRCRCIFLLSAIYE